MRTKILLIAIIIVLNLTVVSDGLNLNTEALAMNTTTNTIKTLPPKTTVKTSTPLTSTTKSLVTAKQTQALSPVQKVLQGGKNLVTKVTQMIKSRLGIKARPRKISRKKRVFTRPKKKVNSKRTLKNNAKKAPVVRNQIQSGR